MPFERRAAPSLPARKQHLLRALFYRSPLAVLSGEKAQCFFNHGVSVLQKMRFAPR